MPAANLSPSTFHYGLRDMIVALWLAENSYGDYFDLPAAATLTVNLETQANQLQGDDVIVDQYAKIIAVTAQASWGAVDFEVSEIITGGVLVSNGEYQDLMISQDDNVPYFCIAGRVVGSNQGDLHMLLPKVKLAGNYQFQAQQNNYLVPTLDLRGVWEGEINGFIRQRKFASPTGLEIPLRTAVGFA